MLSYQYGDALYSHIAIAYLKNMFLNSCRLCEFPPHLCLVCQSGNFPNVVSQAKPNSAHPVKFCHWNRKTQITFGINKQLR